MKIGVPKEIKSNEKRISLVPDGAAPLVSAGHTVILESGAGLGSDFTDEQYLLADAQVAHDADAIWPASDLIVEAKEPIEPEWKRIKPEQTIFTYFHFAANEQRKIRR
jgi:alanine dehydrogenase